MLTELARSVRERRVHPTELVEEALRRIDKLDGPINAVVALGAEQALEAAKQSPCEGPLAGIPYLVKDLARCIGLPTSYGSPFSAGGPPETVDDTTVARLRAAGAIPIGKSNSPAYGWTAATTNPVFGSTRNPWNLERTPGGSSGGSAAALAAGMVSMATATDTGGSIRIPAAYSGLVGLKPTNGTIPRDPAARAMDWIDMTTDGPLGVTVDDVRLQLAVLAGTRPIERSGPPSRLFVLDRWVPRMPLPAEDAALFEVAVAVRAAEAGLEPERPDVSELFHGADLDVD